MASRAFARSGVLRRDPCPRGALEDYTGVVPGSEAEYTRRIVMVPTTPRAWLVLAALSVVACSGRADVPQDSNPGSTDDAVPRSCTLAACPLPAIQFVMASTVPAGNYEFAFDLDGVALTCHAVVEAQDAVPLFGAVPPARTKGQHQCWVENPFCR